MTEQNYCLLRLLFFVVVFFCFVSFFCYYCFLFLCVSFGLIEVNTLYLLDFLLNSLLKRGPLGANSFLKGKRRSRGRKTFEQLTPLSESIITHTWVKISVDIR